MYARVIKKMNYYILLNAIGLFIVNLFFLFAGACLNIVAVLSIWKSSQLRKKLCYFMILILSSIDFVVVIFIHPVLILGCIIWYYKDASILGDEFDTFIFVGGILLGSSELVLFIMTVERYMGLTRPLFHKTSVTKRRIIIFMSITHVFYFIIEICNFTLESPSITEAYIVLFITLSVVVVFMMNYKMFVIAKSRTKNTQPCDERIIQYKRYYACAFAVGCYLLCCTPITIYYGLQLTNTLTEKSNIAACLFLWSVTIQTMNSTINSLIFFWMNNVLCSEGKKLLKACGLLKS